jgi:GntR family transcriptional regulator, transcriptional repressor for pyruvate dehydrogenase complex
MQELKINNQGITLVDQVEDKLFAYFSENNFHLGSRLPNELELAEALGVARSVLREALSRLKMMGIIETRTRRGMTLTERTLLGPMRKGLMPNMLSEDTMLDLLEFRIVLEIGLCETIFMNIKPEDIRELEAIVKISEVSDHNEYATVNEFAFHSKLYQIAGNKSISEFQNIIRDVMEFIKTRFHDLFYNIAVELKQQSAQVSHKDLLEYLKAGDKDGYRKALEQHFKIYRIFISRKKIKQ